VIEEESEGSEGRERGRERGESEGREEERIIISI